MKYGIVVFAILTAFAGTAVGQGWQPDQPLHTQVQKEQEGSCARFPGTTTNVCVYEVQNGSGQLDLFERQTSDGGVTWSSPVQITSDSGDEYDTFAASDPLRGRILILYSKWGAFGGNDLILRYKACTGCAWSSPITVIADGANHWDASLLVLNSGDILALETLEGFGGSAQGKIRSIRSTNGGYAWASPSVIFDESGEEIYPVAVQKSDGYIHLMFRDGNHSSTLQIGQLWSSDNGYTWTGHSVFANSAPAKQFSFIGSQGGQNVTVVASIFNGSNWYVNHWISWDNGLTWSGPYQVTAVAGAGDSEFSLGCRGPIFTYSANANVFAARRYDWSSSCQY